MADEWEIGSEVFTEDGRKAEYAGEIGGQKFVRIMLSLDDECGHEEWPSDKLTPVSRVFTTAPMEVLDKRVAEARDRLAKINESAAMARLECAEAEASAKEIRAAAEKHPDIRLAVDFLEGRITHVVIEKHGEISVCSLEDVLTYSDDALGRGIQNGLKLLCLFGHRKGEKPRWAINRYYDGSGSYTTVDPFRSEAEAKAEVQRRADAAFAAWRAGEKVHYLERFAKAGANIPQDYLNHLAAEKQQAASRKIAELHAKIAEIEHNLTVPS